MSLLTRYNKSKGMKKYASGGWFSPDDATKKSLSSTIGLAGAVGGGLIDAFGKGDTKVGGALSSGLNLAAAGAAAGPLGALAGGAVGLATGWIGASRRKKQLAEQNKLLKDREIQASRDAGQAAIAADPSLVYGNRDASYFANGGQLSGPGDPKEKKPIQLDEVTITAKRLPERRYPFGRRGETMSQEEWDYSRTKRGYEDVYSDKVRGPQNFVPGESYANAIRNDIKEFQATKKTKLANGGPLTSQYYKANGGQLKQLNSGAVEVQGKSHAEGGVQLPDANAEVEGGETISDGFVFSDRLGFAKQHKTLAKAIGKIEKKVKDPVTTKTLEVLRNKETALALSQEYFKQQNGLPSEIDNMEAQG